ncbi:MAG: hypothetical protein AAF901_06355 [Bacteroidota bacterium]
MKEINRRKFIKQGGQTLLATSLIGAVMGMSNAKNNKEAEPSMVDYEFQKGGINC